MEWATALLDEVGNVHERASLLAAAAGIALELGSYPDAKEFLGRAIPIAREFDDRRLWVLIQINFGMYALLTHDTDAARQALRDAMSLCRDLVIRPFVHLPLMGLATLDATHDDTYRAAKLSGAAMAHRYGEPVPADEARVNATFIQPARARYGADAWDAAAREGAALSFDHAIAYALDEPPT